VKILDNAAMVKSGRSDAEPLELSDEARRTAEKHRLGALLNSFPVQRQVFVLPKYKNTGHWLHQFEDGILAADGGSAVLPMRYDETTRVHQMYKHRFMRAGYQGSEYRFKIATAGTMAIALRGEFWDPESALVLRSSKGDASLPAYCQSLAVEVSKAHLDLAWKDLQEGKALTFDEIVFTADGVRSGTDVVSWRDIAPMLIIRGTVRIVRAQNRVEVAAAPLFSVPNLPLLHVLTERLRKDPRSADMGKPNMAQSSERRGKQR
jgi:hypothetical protein